MRKLLETVGRWILLCPKLVDGRPLYELVGEKVAQWGEELMGDEYSYIGAVVGATYPEMGKVLRKIKSAVEKPNFLNAPQPCQS